LEVLAAVFATLLPSLRASLTSQTRVQCLESRVQTLEIGNLVLDDEADAVVGHLLVREESESVGCGGAVRAVAPCHGHSIPATDFIGFFTPKTYINRSVE